MTGQVCRKSPKVMKTLPPKGRSVFVILHNIESTHSTAALFAIGVSSQTIRTALHKRAPLLEFGIMGDSKNSLYLFTGIYKNILILSNKI